MRNILTGSSFIVFSAFMLGACGNNHKQAGSAGDTVVKPAANLGCVANGRLVTSAIYIRGIDEAKSSAEKIVTLGDMQKIEKNGATITIGEKTFLGPLTTSMASKSIASFDLQSLKLSSSKDGSELKIAIMDSRDDGLQDLLVVLPEDAIAIARQLLKVGESESQIADICDASYSKNVMIDPSSKTVTYSIKSDVKIQYKDAAKMIEQLENDKDTSTKLHLDGATVDESKFHGPDTQPGLQLNVNTKLDVDTSGLSL